ncbi:uncharacterized protein [Eleutherodactylus coqui]|uniref:uncharacterized protein isoform X9 n=1 Tax=Eleutherodactylus coqui TaxID=57060 RepID=UPI003462912A
MKKREVAGDTGGADWPTQPPKKLKTEEMTLPAAQPEVVNNYGWRGDTSKMFSCSLCQYHTPDEEQIMEHFNSSEHKDILKHLFIFFPQHRLDFLQEYFLYVKEEMSMQQKNSDMPPIRDKFKGIGQEHYLHRIQAAHCRACELLIPDVPELLTAHITSPTHKENCKTTFRTIKINSYAVAKELFLDEKILEMLKIYSQKQKPIKEIVACLSQVNSTDYDVLVAEEDDDDDSSDEDAIANPVVPCDRNEDSIAEAKADPEVRGNRNEDSITEAKADPEVPGNHNEGSIAEAKADPEVPGNHNEGSIAEAKAHPEAPATHKEHAIADAKAHPEVPGNRNEDVIAVEKVDAKVPIIHKQGPAHENKGHPGSIVPCPPMNIPKNMPSSSTVNPQLIPKSKMTNPDLTNYNRFRVQNDFQFAENFDLDEDAFLVGSYGLEFTKKIGPTYRYHAEQKGTPPLLHQGGKKKNKAAAKHAKKQQVINQPQSSGAAAKNQQKQQVITQALDRLADQATTIQDVTQDIGESVEKFHLRLTQTFHNLGFSTQIKAHAQMLLSAFVMGLQEPIKKVLIKASPEYQSLIMKTSLLVAKGLESQGGQKQTAPLMLTVPPPYGQNVQTCFKCGQPGHFKKECKDPRRARPMESQQWSQNGQQQQPQDPHNCPPGESYPPPPPHSTQEHLDLLH